MEPASPAFELLPRDLAPYRAGNTGIPYVHRFESGRPGPHVLVNALTHGNEFCGMVAATHLLDTGVRPRIGTLTVSFANVAAYESFDASRPFDSRQLVHNLNRIWSSGWLEGGEASPELERARELRPAVAAADHILDLHSTSNDVPPFWVYPHFERNGRAALAIGLPRVHLVMPLGLGSGTPVIQHGRHGDAGHHGVALVAECGQHFKRASGETARRVTMRFLAHFGLVDAAAADSEGDSAAAAGDQAAGPGPAPPPRRYELLQTCMVRTTAFAFTRPLRGFETFAEGELIATDGDDEIRAPCDDCTVMMPTRAAIVGREGVYLTRPMAA
ncbi:MAG: succinylglutamate desuccinylase/aspartoacylase family protein [Rubrivivax sp.]|nr:succinylglutamate desuccinylase/aspartoacylase family protein [Rubrivivax sp.]